MGYRPLHQRFWERVHVGDSLLDCWLFDGHDRGPIGHKGIKAEAPSRANLGAHRVSYALANNIDPHTMPADLVIRHTCDNPPCVNPAHLLAGTQADNNADKMQRGRHRSGNSWRDGRCVNGHDVTDPSNVRVASDGKRTCRTCLGLRLRQQRARKLVA
jgi:hypothetical protein